MTFKEKFEKDFGSPYVKLLLRYKSSKMILVFFALLFFISFYFVGAGFYTDIFSSLLSVFYILFLTSLFFYLVLFIKHVFGSNIKLIYNIFIYISFFILYLFLLFPILYKGGFYGFYTNFLNF
ncbi:hypothetical protein HUU51_02600 [Candidatus Gracilibacteria bacterium]|nr:hypothetical protein [Candidatus Gracilibacteria bacterium]